jgi:TonB family protein
MKSLIAIAALSALSLNAQIINQVTGVVTDPSGARVPGATVTATDNSGHRITTKARADGSFSFAGLAEGRYDIAVRQPGFAVYHANVVNIKAGLNLGRITENMVVTAVGTPRPQEQAPEAPKPIRVGGNVQAANLLSQVKPVYPPDMKEQRLEGTVVLQAVISKDGVPISLNSQSADTNRAFVDAAIEAVKQWRYRPTLLAQ